MNARVFRARHRGGGLVSEAVSQPLGSYLALAAYRLGMPPTVLTLLNLVIGAGASLAVTALAGSMPANSGLKRTRAVYYNLLFAAGRAKARSHVRMEARKWVVRR